MKNITCTHCGLVKSSVKLALFFWTIFFIRFGTKLYRQIVVIPIVTNCASLVTDLFCYERDFTLSFSDDKQAEIIEGFNSTSKYLDDLFCMYIDNLLKNKTSARVF